MQYWIYLQSVLKRGQKPMKCPKCSSMNDKVIGSRVTDNGAAVRRRRLCRDCSARWTTYEKEWPEAPVTEPVLKDPRISRQAH